MDKKTKNKLKKQLQEVNEMIVRTENTYHQLLGRKTTLEELLNEKE